MNTIYLNGARGAKAGNIGYQEEKSPTLNAGKQMTVVVEGNGSRPSHKGDGYAESETMYTLNGTEHHAVAYRKTSHAKSAEDGQGWAETEVNDTLNAFDSGETRTPTVIVDNKKTVYDWHRCDTRMTELGDTCNTMSASWGAGGNNMPYVLEEPYNATTGSFMRAGNSGIAETLAARDYKDPQIVCNSVVRRLTPLECERLQGYPDNWTNIGDWINHRGRKRKGSADSPRYKALGNSIALPFWQWLAERMVKWLPDSPTMGSLFDEIGGFPLVYSRVGCEPIWASEIEDFPIAVTKKRFPDVERRKNDEAD